MRGKFVAALAVIAVSLASAERIDFGTGVSEAKGGMRSEETLLTGK